MVAQKIWRIWNPASADAAIQKLTLNNAVKKTYL